MTHTSKSHSVLFDLDGTLLDTARDLGGALNWVLTQYDLAPIEYESYRCVASDGSLGLLQLGFGEKLQSYDVDSLRQQFLDYYNDNICKDTILFPGIPDLVNYLESESIPWGIVTNKPGWLTDKLLPNFPELSGSQITISGDTFPERKPSPVPLINAAKSLQVECVNTYYVGDAQRDMDAAHAAQMKSVLADYGYLTLEQRNKHWRVNYRIEQALDLLTILQHC